MRVQCKTCPWKKGASVADIPRYDEALHHGFADTIAEPGALAARGAPLLLMACHYSGGPGKELPCVGWLANQIGPGNNLLLRLRALTDPSLREFRTVGPQHEHFEDTLPPPRKAPAR